MDNSCFHCHSKIVAHSELGHYALASVNYGQQSDVIIAVMWTINWWLAVNESSWWEKSLYFLIPWWREAFRIYNVLVTKLDQNTAILTQLWSPYTRRQGAENCTAWVSYFKSAEGADNFTQAYRCPWRRQGADIPTFLRRELFRRLLLVSGNSTWELTLKSSFMVVMTLGLSRRYYTEDRKGTNLSPAWK